MDQHHDQVPFVCRELSLSLEIKQSEVLPCPRGRQQDIEEDGAGQAQS